MQKSLLSCTLKDFSEFDEISFKVYREHFLHTEHFNFLGEDALLGPVLLSIKYNKEEHTRTNQIRIIIRLSNRFQHELLVWDPSVKSRPPIQLVKIILPELSIERLEPVLCPNSAEKILKYDE